MIYTAALVFEDNCVLQMECPNPGLLAELIAGATYTETETELNCDEILVALCDRRCGLAIKESFFNVSQYHWVFGYAGEEEETEEEVKQENDKTEV